MQMFGANGDRDSIGNVEIEELKKLVLLLSMELFPLSNSDSKVTVAKFWMGSVPIL